MSISLVMAAVLGTVGATQSPDASSWPTTAVGASEHLICAIDPRTWRRTWRGRPQAVEICVYGDATVGGVPVTHSTATIEWRCEGDRSVTRSSVSFHHVGRRDPVAVQREGYEREDGPTSPCLSRNNSTARTDQEPAEAFIANQLRAWGRVPAARPTEGNPPRWTEVPVGATRGAGCALALEDLVRRARVAIGRVACVYDPAVYTPHRLEAGRDGQPLRFRHERGFVLAECDRRQLYWSQGDLFESAQDRTPYRAGSGDRGRYLGPFALYGAGQGDAVVDLLCGDPRTRAVVEGGLDDFVRTRLAAWGES